MVNPALLLSPHNCQRARGSRGALGFSAKLGSSAGGALAGSFAFYSAGRLRSGLVVALGSNPAVKRTGLRPSAYFVR